MSKNRLALNRVAISETKAEIAHFERQDVTNMTQIELAVHTRLLDMLRKKLERQEITLAANEKIHGYRNPPEEKNKKKA